MSHNLDVECSAFTDYSNMIIGNPTPKITCQVDVYYQAKPLSPMGVWILRLLQRPEREEIINTHINPTYYCNNHYLSFYGILKVEKLEL